MEQGKKWLVPLDGSDNSESAFNFALERMERTRDELWLMTVCSRVSTHLYTHSFVSADFILDAQHKLEDHAKSLLRAHAKTAHAAHVKTVHLVMSTSDNVGELICQAAKEKKADFVVMGRRGMGTIARLLLGSVSRYVLENAPCDVVVVKSTVGPEVAHDTTKEAVKRAEEVERARRIESLKQEEQDEQKRRHFQSELDRNVARLAEEEERRRRLEALDQRHKREQVEREAAGEGHPITILHPAPQ